MALWRGPRFRQGAHAQLRAFEIIVARVTGVLRRGASASKASAVCPQAVQLHGLNPISNKLVGLSLSWEIDKTRVQRRANAIRLKRRAIESRRKHPPAVINVMMAKGRWGTHRRWRDNAWWPQCAMH